MKLFRSLAGYCLIIIFILSLSSSFQFDSTKVISNPSIKSEKMYELFYSTSQLDDDGKENTDVEENLPVTNDDVETYTESKIGDSGEEVHKYQKLLYYMDYLKSKPDGNFGDNMKSAVEKYQEDKKLEVTGNLDVKTIEALLKESIEYKSGKTGDEIKQFQLVLYYMDYLQTYPLGEFGTDTVNSVKKYQKDNSLEETGILDQKTQESLNSEKVVYKVGKKGDAIKEYQNILINLGYLSGTADGNLGNMSSNALKQYQENNGLEATGIIDIDTQASLKKPIEEQERF